MKPSSSRKLIVRFMASNMIIVLITLVIGVFGYREAVKIVEYEVQNANLAVLEQIKGIMDSKLSEIESETLKIAMNPKVKAMANKKAPHPMMFYYELKELLDQMSLQMLNEDIQSFYLFLNNSEYIISSETVYQADFFYQQVFNYNDMTYSQWVDEILDNNNNNKYLPEASVKIGEQEYSLIPYIQSLHKSIPENKLGAIIVLIKRDEIYKLLNRINGFDKGMFYIESKDQGVITSFGIEKDDNIVFDLDPNISSGFTEATINGKDVLVTYSNSEYNDSRYVLALPTKVVMLEANYIKQLVWVIFAISLFLGSIIAYFSALRNAKPLNGIISVLKEFSGEDNSQNSETYEYLTGSVNKLIENNKELKESMDKQMPYIEAFFFARLLNGEYKNKNEIDAVSSYLNIEIIGDAYVVLILRLYGYDNSIEINENVIKEWNLTRLLVKNTIKNHIDTEYMSDIDSNNIAIILPFKKGEPDQYIQQTEKLVNDIYNEILQLYNLKVFFAAGSIYNNITETDQSYQRARQTLNSKLKQKNNIIVWYDDISKHGEGYHYPIEVEQKIINFAKSGDIEKVEQQLEFIYNENFVNRKLLAGMGKEFIGEKKGTIIKILSQCSFEYDMSEYIEGIHMYDSVEDIYDNIKLIYRKICEKVIEQKNNSNKELISKIIEYIDINYMEPDIGLYKVASQFDMSEGYLCHFFKDNTGENFTSYIENLRLNNACIMLKDSKYTIKHIATHVGYNSVQSFRRAFKRHNGVSPSEYR